MIFKFYKYKFGNKFYEIALYKKIILELLMFLGRLFTKRILKTRDIKSLQLECGVLDIKKTYLNLNFYKQEFNHDIN